METQKYKVEFYLLNGGKAHVIKDGPFSSLQWYLDDVAEHGVTLFDKDKARTTIILPQAISTVEISEVEAK